MKSEDRALVERSQAGELDAFERLVEKYRHRVWRLAYNHLRDREEAWDVAQEAFVRAWQALGSFRGQSQFYTWLFRIVVNVATDRARQRAARARAFGIEPMPVDELDRTAAAPAPDDVAARVEARQRLQRALDALPEHHRTIIMLSDLEGLSYREIADVLSIPMGTVMSRLHNARKRLRHLLGGLLVALLVAGTVAVAIGAVTDPAWAEQRTVRFGTRVLLASDGPPPAGTHLAREGPDEQLQHLLQRLKQLFRYREYASLEVYRAEVPVGATQRWPVPGERQLELTPEAVSEGAVRLRCRLVRGRVSEVTTNIVAAPGNPAIIGGPRFADGVLIIVVWARANP